MAPYNNNAADVYVAAKEISASLSHLRREHGDTKNAISTLFDQILIQQRHMNRIDELIDQHQAKIDELMHMTVNQMEPLVDQTQSLPNDLNLHQQQRAYSSTSSDQQPHAQVPVLDWPNANSHSPTAITVVAADNGTEQNWSVGPSGELAPQINHETNDNIPASVAVKPEVFTSDALVVPSEVQQEDPLTSMLDCQPSTSTSNQPTQKSKSQKHRKTRKIGSSKHDAVRKSLARAMLAFAPTQLPGQIGSHSQAPTGYVDSQGTVSLRCCGHEFPNRGNFNRHYRDCHEMRRPHKCRFCPFTTARSTSLTRHEMTHRLRQGL